VPNFWWVNHKQTVVQEISGQYLWSPKRNKNSGKNQFYNNMIRARPNDRVLSYANGRIGFVGRVTDHAFSARKPSEFGKVGDNWSDDGWLLPVYWVPFEPSVEIKPILSRIFPLLPHKYSPISHNTGGGNQGAYLASISRELFEFIAEQAAHSESELRSGGGNRLNFDVLKEEIESEIVKSIENDTSIDQTEREMLVKARKGQGVFRKNVEAIETSCRLTGITNAQLLIASHIKPWRSCKSADERLDGMNGLLLTPDADRLFDRGFITFEDDGGVDVSPAVSESDLIRLGFSEIARKSFGFGEATVRWGAGHFQAEQLKYLKFHREEVFLRH